MVESNIAESLSRAYNQDIGQSGMEFRTLPYCDRPGHERTKTTEIGDCGPVEKAPFLLLI
jgi:hypothetical protein